MVLMLSCVTGNFSALALPQGEQVEAGSASFSHSGDTLNINAADSTVINFNSFNIAEHETVNFIQPDSNSSVLSRVTGGAPSVIAGSLYANGRLFLVNTNGIMIGSTAIINANTFVASTLDIATNDFINKNYIFSKKEGSAYAQIINQGIITGDNIALLSSGIDNQGAIIATIGKVELAVGDKAVVAFDASGIINVEVTEATASEYGINNSGTIEAHHVVMTARTASDIFEKAINTTGIVRATKIASVGGRIRIVADKSIHVSGTLEAADGTIEVTAGKDIKIPAPLNLTGDALFQANNNIEVEANILSQGGRLVFLADKDSDRRGGFLQREDTNISAESLSVSAPSIELATTTLNLSLYKTVGELSFTTSALNGNQVTLQGPEVKITYLANANVTLKSDNAINSNPGVILQANSLSLISNRFGSYEVPLEVEANSLRIQKLLGDINILESQGIGTSILLRGPPEDSLNIMYPDTATLTLNAANVIINGATLTLSADLTIYGNFILNNGSILNAASSIITISGDWVNNGTFNAGTSTVILIDSSVASHIKGQTTFHNLTCITPGKVLIFDAGVLTTVAGMFTIDGAEGNNVVLKSSESGTKFKIYLNAVDNGHNTYYLEYLTVIDSEAQGPLLPIPCINETIDEVINPTWDNSPNAYWIGGTGSWSDNTNHWRTLSGGTIMAAVPSSATNVYFDQNSGTGTATLPASSVSIYALSLANSTMTLDLNGQTLNVSSSFTMGSTTYTAVNATIQNGTLSLISSSNFYNGTISANISGLSSVVKAGSGTLILAGTVTGSLGAITVSGGTLQIGNNGTTGSLPTVGITVVPTATLRFNRTDTYTFSNNIANSGTVNNAGSGTLTLSGVISEFAGSGVFTQSGTGTTILTGLNTFSGSLTISAGILSISSVNASATAAQPLGEGSIILGGGTLQYTGLAAASPKLITLNATSTIAVTTQGLTLSGTISGTGGLTKTGTAGTLTLSGTNSFSGQLTVAAGTLSIATINNASANGPLGNNSLSVILGSSGVTGTLKYTGATASSTKTFTLAAGGTGAFQISTGATNLTLSGVIDGSGAMQKTDTGTLILSGANSYTGATTVTAGTLQMGNNGTTGTISASSAISVSSGATLKFNRSDTSLTFSNNIADSGTVNNAGSGTLTLSGIISGTGGTFTQSGTGTTILSNTNTYSGVTTISAGTLTLGISNAISSATVTIASGATLDLAGYALTSAGATSFSNSGTIKLTGAQGQADITTPTNNNLSLVKYYGVAGPYTLQNWTYDSLELASASAATYYLPALLTINKNLTIGANNTLDTTASHFDINIGGSWTNSGTFINNNNTINFNGTSNLKQITSGLNNPFYNISFIGLGGEWTLQDNMTVTGAFKVTNGVFISGAHTVLLSGTNATYLGSDVNAANTNWTGGTLNIQSNLDQTLASNETYNNIELGRYDVLGTTRYTIGSSSAINGTGTIDDEAKVMLTVSATGINKVYDGFDIATVTLSSDNIFSSYIPTFTYSASFNNKNAATAKSVNVSGITLDNYANRFELTLATALATADITPRLLSLSDFTASNKVYDASTSVSGTSFSDNRVTGDELTFSYSASFNNKNAGTSKAVNYTGITISGGADQNNYALSSTSGLASANITPKEVTVDGIFAYNKVYDGTTAAILNTTSAALAGIISGDTVALDTLAAVGTFNNKNEGNGKTVYVSGLSTSGLDSGNYSLTQPTVTANILPKAVTTVTWTGTISNDWNNPLNWDLGIVPAPTDKVIIPETATMPALTSDLTIDQLTIHEGATFNTQGNNLTVSQDLNLNGNLSMGQGRLTINGNLIPGTNGTFSGNNSGVYTDGYIGTINNPLNILATGTTTLSAEGMNDLVSVSTRSNSNNTYDNNIPGFIFLNNSLLNNQGQSQIRGELIQGSSPMFRPNIMPFMLMMPMPMPMAPISVIPSMPIVMPQVQVAPQVQVPVPQVEALPEPTVMPSIEAVVPQPAVIIPQPVLSTPEIAPLPKENIMPIKPSFEGTKATSRIQPVPSFKDISVNTELPAPTSFKDASTIEHLPLKTNFTETTSKATLPQSLEEKFGGVKSTLSIQLISKEELMANEGLHQARFDGVKFKTNLPKPIDLTTFDNVRVGAAFKISFPAEGNFSTIHRVGFPLGAEKPLLEPNFELLPGSKEPQDKK